MGKQILTFGNIKIEKYKFYCHKTIFWEMQILKKY